MSNPQIQINKKAMFEGGNAPPGGVCLSSFLVITRGSDVLLGKMAKPEIWIERFFLSPERAPIVFASNKFLVPGMHLAWYESPEDAARRIAIEQTLIAENDVKSLKLLGVQSHLRNEPPHWDICFVYEMKVPYDFPKNLSKPEWFEDFGFVERSTLSPDDFARAQGDVLEEAGIIKTKPKSP